MTVVSQERRYLRLEDGHCAALRIDPITRRFACGIYDRRPDACRALESGSSACREQRDEKAERPLIAIDQLLRSATP